MRKKIVMMKFIDIIVLLYVAFHWIVSWHLQHTTFLLPYLKEKCCKCIRIGIIIFKMLIC